MKKTFIALTAVGAVLGGTLLIGTATNAFGFGPGMGSERHIESTAEILGIDSETLKTELEDKTFSEVVEAQGITQEEFESEMEQAAIERMKERGLSDEEIQTRLDEREERQQVHLQSFADLMGISPEALEQELETLTMPELLDKYDVSHVALHDARMDMRPEFEGKGFGMHGRHGGR